MMNKLLNNDILFIFPHQLQFFEKKTFDIFIAIGCLCEMDKKTIKKYMNYVDTLSKYLYFEVWDNTKVPFSIVKNKKKIKRFTQLIRKNFNIEILKNTTRNPFISKRLSMISDNDRWLIVSEGRPREMNWIICKPKSKRN